LINNLGINLLIKDAKKHLSSILVGQLKIDLKTIMDGRSWQEDSTNVWQDNTNFDTLMIERKDFNDIKDLNSLSNFQVSSINAAKLVNLFEYIDTQKIFVNKFPKVHF